MLRAVTITLAIALLSCGGPQSADSTTSIVSGWEQYRIGEYKKSVAGFTAAKDSARSEDEKIRALYSLACVDEFSPVADHVAAGELYRRIIEEAPTHDYATWSELALARSRHLVGSDDTLDLPAVRAAYQSVIDHHPGHEAAEEAFLRQQATYVTTLKAEDAAKAAESIERHLNEAKGTPYASAFHSLLAEAYGVQRKPELALRARIAAIDAIGGDPADRPDLAWAYWQIATVAEFDVGDFATARQYYRLLIAEYPKDSRLYPCKVALRRMDELEAKVRAEPR